MLKAIKKKLKYKKKSFEKHETIWFVLLLLILIFPAVRNLIRPGYFYMQDDLQAFRIYEMNQCVSDGQFPCRWVPDAGYGYGYPQFIFYSPLVYYAGEVVHLAGFQFIDSVKIIFVLGYILSAFGMFLLVKSIVGKWPALVSSVLYTYVPYKAVEVYVRGALSEFWALVFFPFIFWASYMYIKKEKNKYFIWLSLFVAFLLLTHNLMPMIFLPVFFIWILYWLWVEKKWRITPKIFLSGLLGVGLSAFFFLPMIFERVYVHSESLLGGYFDYRQHFVSLYKLFLDRSWGYGSSGFPNEIFNVSTGLIQWIFGLISVFLGILFLKKNRKISLLILVLGAVELLVLFMMHMKSSFIWSALPFLSWLQFPWRFLSLSIFLLALIAGLGLSLISKYKGFLGIILIVLSVVLTVNYFKVRDWMYISDKDKFSGISWKKQQTISIFDYLPIYAEFPPISQAPNLPEVLEGEVVFIEYEKGSDWQKGIVEVKNDSKIRLPLMDFPGMVVEVDGKTISFVNNDCRGEPFCYGLITFNIPKGEHIIEAKLSNTPVRKIGNIISLLGLFSIIFVVFKCKFNE